MRSQRKYFLINEEEINDLEYMRWPEDRIKLAEACRARPAQCRVLESLPDTPPSLDDLFYEIVDWAMQNKDIKPLAMIALRKKIDKIRQEQQIVPDQSTHEP
jgi:hypothetical protein